MDEQIATAIEADHVNSRKVQILQSVKGCGPVTVNTFMAELSKLLDSSIGRKLRSSLELLPSTMIPDFRPGNERPLEVVRQCVAGSTWRRPTDRTLPCHSAVPGRESSTTQRRCCQCASRRTTHHACRRFASVGTGLPERACVSYRESELFNQDQPQVTRGTCFHSRDGRPDYVLSSVLTMPFVPATFCVIRRYLSSDLRCTTGRTGDRYRRSVSRCIPYGTFRS